MTFYKYKMSLTVSCSHFSPFGRAECTHLLRYQSIEVNHDICSSDALNMDALNS